MGYKQLSPGLRVGAEVVEQRRQARTGDLGTGGALLELAQVPVPRGCLPLISLRQPETTSSKCVCPCCTRVVFFFFSDLGILNLQEHLCTSQNSVSSHSRSDGVGSHPPLTLSSCATLSKLFDVLGLDCGVETNRASGMAPHVKALATSLSSVPRTRVVKESTTPSSCPLSSACAHK